MPQTNKKRVYWIIGSVGIGSVLGVRSFGRSLSAVGVFLRPEIRFRLKTGGSWLTEEGNRFLRLASTEPGQMVLLYRTIDIPAGVKALELTWRQRISDLKPGKEPWFDARIMLEFKDDAGKKMSGKPSPPNTRSNTTGWIERRIQFLVPPEALTLEEFASLSRAVL